MPVLIILIRDVKVSLVSVIVIREECCQSWFGNGTLL